MPRSQVQQDNLFSKFYNTQLLQAASLTLDSTYVYTNNKFAATVAQTLTIPVNFSQEFFPTGAQCYLIPIGTAGVTIAPAANVTLNGGSSNVSLGTVAFGGIVVLQRLDVNEWAVLAGNASAGAVTGSSIDGYIDGFRMSFSATTQVTISSGNAFVPSLGAILSSDAPINITGSPSPGLNHFYLFSNAGAAAIERSTTAPVLYSGTAYTKTGDNSRRYLGSLVGQSNVYLDFTHIDNWIYLAQQQQVLTNGTAAFVPTAISLAGFLPITAVLAAITAQNTSTAQPVNITRDATNGQLFLQATAYVYANMPIAFSGSTPQISYFYSLAPATGLDVFVNGFYFGR